MNIGITASSKYNNYIVILTYLLKLKFDKPVLILYKSEPAKKKIIELLKHSKLFILINFFFQRFIKRRPISVDYLREYAELNDIYDWDISILDICNKEKISYKQVSSINSKIAIKTVKDKKIDLLINAGGGIFKLELINSPKIGILNTHMGYLPKYRGMNALEWSLFYDEKIGVTLHFIKPGIDTGDILLFKEILLNDGDTIASLRRKSLNIGLDLILDGINGIENERIKRTKQVNNDGKQYFFMHPRLKKYVESKIS
jgi:folate-dependent phosphoribosylglycinamide formyltransferase PurN